MSDVFLSENVCLCITEILMRMKHAYACIISQVLLTNNAYQISSNVSNHVTKAKN